MANSITVGKVEVTSLSDGSLEFDLCNFYPSLPEEDWKPYHEYLTADHRVHLELASYLVRSDGRTILVDTGMGPPPDDMPDATWGELVRNLEALGVQPGDVDTVVMTHAHRDHVGCSTTTNSGTHKPTFPNARHYVSSTDWEACHREDMRERFPNGPGARLASGGAGPTRAHARRTRPYQRADGGPDSRPHAGPRQHRDQLPGREGDNPRRHTPQ